MLLVKGEATLMTGMSTPPNRSARQRRSLASLLLFVVIGAACGGDGIGPSTESALPADSAAAAPADPASPGDTLATPPGDSIAVADSTVPPPDSTPTGDTMVPAVDGSLLAGITFGTTNLPPSYLNSVHTGTLLGGPLSPSNIVSTLTEVRSRGGRIVVKLCKGSDHYVKNADGTFSFTKWKALVDRYRYVNLGPFIADGTILGHYLIDEPHRAVRWGGKIISPATLEAMAAYSKKIWPTMPALVRVVPSWLATSSVTYTHLDAGWLQYTAKKGDVTQLVTAEVAAAKRKALGLVVGMNVSEGGKSGAMTATEVRAYGSVLLNQSYTCGFYMYHHDPSYFSRSDIRTAMAELSAKARNHAKTSCRQ